MSLPGQSKRDLLDKILPIPSAAIAIALAGCLKAHRELQEKEFNDTLIYGESAGTLVRITTPMGSNRLLINQAITGDLTLCRDS